MSKAIERKEEPGQDVPNTRADPALSKEGIRALRGESAVDVPFGEKAQPNADAKLERGSIETDRVKMILGRKSLWSDDSGEIIEPKGTSGRGVDYEKLKEANIGGTFETIDDYKPETRTATSYKSIDLNAPSYRHNPAATRAKIVEYVDALSNFDDTVSTQKGRRVEILKEDIDRYVLSLAVPRGSIAEGNEELLRDSHLYADSKGVELKIEEVP